MSNETTTRQTPINGVDTDRIIYLATQMSEVLNYGEFKFRAENHWVVGTYSNTKIKGFYAGQHEQMERREALVVESDQPCFLGGKNIAPNAMEHYLNSLTSCLNATIVAHASVRKISIASLRIFAEGQMNAAGFFGVSKSEVRGFQKIKVIIDAGIETSKETLQELISFSPVYEMVSKAIPVDLQINLN
ncbi:MAG: OsmC family protein [Aestuariibacter sp.]